jgi:hypothetical protein
MRLLTVFELRTSTQGCIGIYRWACTCIYITKFSTGEESSGFVFPVITTAGPTKTPCNSRTFPALLLISHAAIQPPPLVLSCLVFGFGNCSASFLSLSLSLSLTSLCVQKLIWSLCVPRAFLFRVCYVQWVCILACYTPVGVVSC